VSGPLRALGSSIAPAALRNALRALARSSRCCVRQVPGGAFPTGPRSEPTANVGHPEFAKLSYNKDMDAIKIERAIASIVASTRLEGLETDEQTRELMRRFLRGDIRIEEAIQEVLGSIRRNTA